jgi:hypothetical protein
MILIENGYVQDGLKALIYVIPFMYLIVRRKSLKLKYFWFFFIGLFLLFFGNVLDFMDEFEFLREMFPTEGEHYLQDFFEDMVGAALGFIVFSAGLYMEFFRKKIAKS